MYLRGISLDKVSDVVADISIRSYNGNLTIKNGVRLASGCRFTLGILECTPLLMNKETKGNLELLVRCSGRYRTVDAPQVCYDKVLKEL